MDETAVVEVTVDAPEEPAGRVETADAPVDASAEAAAASATTAAAAAEAAVVTAHAAAAMAEVQAAEIIADAEENVVTLENRVELCEAQLTEAMVLLNTVASQQTAILTTLEQLTASHSSIPESSEELSQAEATTDPNVSVVVESPAPRTGKLRRLL